MTVDKKTMDPKRGSIQTFMDPFGQVHARAAMPACLTVAGSDCSGGAGVQADLKVMTANCVYGMSALTSVVAENAGGVDMVECMTPKMVASQIDCCLRDVRCTVAKTGMLPTSEIVKTVAKTLPKYEIDQLVVDPVMVATSGDSLVSDDVARTIVKELLPISTIVTPNLPEALVLSKYGKQPFKSISSVKEMEECAKVIHELGPKYVLLKGGHMTVDKDGNKTSEGRLYVMDVLYDGQKFYHFQSDYLELGEVHGTGCTLGATIASYLAWGYEMPFACKSAIKFVHGAIRLSPAINRCSTAILNHTNRIRVLPFSPGSFVDYILQHPQVAPIWKKYINHPFTNMLAKGTLPLKAYQEYLKQDYRYLIHFSRAYALKAFKQNTFNSIRRSAESVLHILHEKSLHVSMCSEYGITLEALNVTDESPACTAYSRYILDVGMQQDPYALTFAMAPCLLGYREVGLRLAAAPFHKPNGPYERWIQTYIGEEYHNAVIEGKADLERIAVELSPKRLEEVIEIFIQCCRFEILFWESPFQEYVVKNGLADGSEQYFNYVPAVLPA
ncbi:TENA/THI family protein [Schizosaccharomyces japonicus yFS275]|uniref:TENA/THI family protein n=1 Tax=Schizosaccharomyces japonicus (strain yFS275 / FY16936) TaxID=402676 RepID=B6K2F2_SCHJY|nr:TENA/THI family protein [Schizosaccharomyces japonicus yFS275]EEB07333.2 TENA/THI family protein [Schizosaccharomyces japonicus yFS275]